VDPLQGLASNSRRLASTHGTAAAFSRGAFFGHSYGCPRGWATPFVDSDDGPNVLRDQPRCRSACLRAGPIGVQEEGGGTTRGTAGPQSITTAPKTLLSAIRDGPRPQTLHVKSCPRHLRRRMKTAGWCPVAGGTSFPIDVDQQHSPPRRTQRLPPKAHLRAAPQSSRQPVR
jgi:hypothetical protein